MSLGNSYPTRSTIPNTDIVRGVWTGGGAAANCTKAPADWSRGIKSITYNAATGKYLVTFVDAGQQYVGGGIDVCGVSGGAKKYAHILRSTYSPSAKTVQVEIQTGAGVLADLLTTEQIVCEFVLVTNKPT